MMIAEKMAEMADGVIEKQLNDYYECLLPETLCKIEAQSKNGMKTLTIDVSKKVVAERLSMYLRSEGFYVTVYSDRLTIDW